jgi:hypothetical protein
LQISQLFLVSFNNPLQTALVAQHKIRVEPEVGNVHAPLWSITAEFMSNSDLLLPIVLWPFQFGLGFHNSDQYSLLIDTDNKWVIH